MTHFYLSPHPDDAALSCGGQIVMLARHGESTVIVTLLAGDPSATFMVLPPTAYAEKLWTRWALGRGAAATESRRLEDVAAAEALGAAIRFGVFPEAIYRMGAGSTLYHDHAGIFGDPHPDDPLWSLTQPDSVALSELIDWLGIMGGDTLNVPLGVGHHVDHQLTRRIGQTIAAVFGSKAKAIVLRYYEEYPYSVQHDEAVTRALHDTALAGQAVPSLQPIDASALAARIAAVGCYQSQISSFWPDADRMATDIRDYVKHVGGERVWLIPTPAERTSGS